VGWRPLAVWAAAIVILYAYSNALLSIIGLPGWQGFATLTALSLGAVVLLGLANRIEPRSKAGLVATIVIVLMNLLLGVNKLASMGANSIWGFLMVPGLLSLYALALWLTFPKVTFPTLEHDPLDHPLDYYRAMTQDEASRYTRELIEKGSEMAIQQFHDHLQSWSDYGFEYFRNEYFRND